ncbi:LETM1 and EF-hand domain-containing protein 1, mitochondrial-like [Quillaja saponaria]|uniref:Mitochondrial proton/calcium exchanger protein n=1 Tax=Quillaja saponaria TaxID=32244 RepID=A0AAD7VJL0_QUISA|nr:LETM1 and EF-hand domain-containing protein 1, mitochondrial-like [Quillaja saponaria]
MLAPTRYPIDRRRRLEALIGSDPLFAENCRCSCLRYGNIFSYMEDIICYYGCENNLAKERDFSSRAPFRISNLACRIGRTHFVYLLRVKWTTIPTHYVSTTAADQPELGHSNDKNEQKTAKQNKEASPGECDQAVEGLSTVKAKAKTKQLQESQKRDKSILKRAWAKLLGIGPALRAIALMSREDWAKKFHHWRDEFKSTIQHYWLGTKLLWADARISSRLLLKLASGKSLSRRERQQLTRTTADIFRLVPFAVFIIVPFMEFLLPVFLKLFPNMLPSTFQDKMKEQEALKRRLNARIEYARFLQDTVKEMAKEIQNSRRGEIKKTAEDLDEFMNKVRTGSRVSNDEILGFAKLFNDELTLDNISRPQLVNMCKYMGISPYGTDAYLQLYTSEKTATLRDWLELSLNHSVPSSLLILSRTFCVSGKVRPEEAVQATLSSLLDEVVDTVGVTALPSEDSASERRRKLEFLEMQEELIKEEGKEEEQARIKESVSSQKEAAIEEMAIPVASKAKEQEKEEKQEHLCELSHALAVLASASSVSREREEFLRLVRKEIKLYNSVTAIADKVSSALIDRVNAMLQKLEKEIDDVDATIGDRWQLLDRDNDGKVTTEEVASAAIYLKDTLGKEGIQELISNLSKDRDGKILVEDIIRLGSKKEDVDTAEAGRS